MSSTPTVTTPLLPGRSGTLPEADPERDPQPRNHPPNVAPSPPAINRLQHVAICAFSALHILRGLVFIAFPAVLIGMSASGRHPAQEEPTDPSSAAHRHHYYYHLLTALLGARDMILGGLLAAADRRRHRRGAHGVHRALAANLLSDAADTFVLIFFAACASAGQQPRRWRPGSPVAEITAVAVVATLEHVTLWSMSTEPGGESGFGGAGGGGGSGFEKTRASPTAGYEARLQAHEDKKRRMDMWLSDMRRAEEMRQPSPLPLMQPQPQKQDEQQQQQQQQQYQHQDPPSSQLQ
ncbi:adaptin ear-binding coat-associated protein 2 [Purpureocillium lavendulum]|uniref:Adaptin ear-binding coat-associated protein 2 n=1 Tax=Purpureocillium lavendulum TaxID=1247861 RepID=A0AB34FZV6_9HYPO|nr:adaptin ear-binding coat-associated protein 2 [Purpureocillium lavendulum]